MSDNTTLRPVMVNYTHDAEPDALHPNGVRAGSVFESASPELADTFHPKATIIRYADGADFNRRAYLKEVRERDEPTTAEVRREDAKRDDSRSTDTAKAKSAKGSQSRSGARSTAKTSAKASDTAKKPTAAQKAAQSAKEQVTASTVVVGMGDEAVAAPASPAMEPATEPVPEVLKLG